MTEEDYHNYTKAWLEDELKEYESKIAHIRNRLEEMSSSETNQFVIFSGTNMIGDLNAQLTWNNPTSSWNYSDQPTTTELTGSSDMKYSSEETRNNILEDHT